MNASPKSAPTARLIKIPTYFFIDSSLIKQDCCNRPNNNRYNRRIQNGGYCTRNNNCKPHAQKKVTFTPKITIAYGFYVRPGIYENQKN